MPLQSFHWKRKTPVSNAPSVSTAPYGVERHGKLVYDTKTGTKKLAQQLGASRIYDRRRSLWIPFDPDTGKILKGTVAQQ